MTDSESFIAAIRARIAGAPTSSAGDPPWLADAKALLAALDARGEPVAWAYEGYLDRMATFDRKWAEAHPDIVTPLYTSPPPTDRDKRLVEAAEYAEEIGLLEYNRADSADRVQCKFCRADSFFKESIPHEQRCPIGVISKALEVYRND